MPCVDEPKTSAEAVSSTADGLARSCALAERLLESSRPTYELQGSRPQLLAS